MPSHIITVPASADVVHAATSDRSRGAAALEFALVLPILLMLVFGTIDFGYMINRTTVLNNAAREGAREAIFNPDATAIEDRVKVAATDTFDPADLTVTVTCRAADGTPCPGVDFTAEWEEGGTAIVHVLYTHDFLTPAPSVFGLGSSRNLSSTVEMRIEG